MPRRWTGRRLTHLRAYMRAGAAWLATGRVELIDHSLLVTLAGTDPALAGHAHGPHRRGFPVVPGTETD